MNGTMMDFPLTLVSILERAGRLFGKVEIVSRMPDRSLRRHTYADFYRRARALAESLQQAGLQRGDRVATLMWNHFAHLEAYFGIPAAGGVLHTLNLRLHPQDLAYIVDHAQDRFLIVDDVLLPLAEKLRERGRFERVLVVPHTGKPVLEGYQNYESFLEKAPGNFAYPDLGENEAAAMCYTSGTTGMPKGVMYSHRALVLHSFVEGLGDCMGLAHRDVILPVVPMFHANAWGMPFTAAMVGSKQIFPGPHLDAESLLELLERERVTLAGGVPAVWLAILEALDSNPGRWQLAPGIRVIVGGTAVPESMIRRFDQYGMKLIQAWGMTEMTPVGTIGRLKAYMEDWSPDTTYALRAKQGLPVPFVEIRAMAESGEVPWNGEAMGELQVRGPWIAASYYNLPEESDKWTEDGWLRTGDVVTIDPEGYVKITDRTKDLIKSGGEWISSVDLESALMGHPGVKEAAVIALPHPKWDERPLALVVLKDGMKVTSDELRAFLAVRFAKWQLPDAFVFTETIPRTTVGKILKTRLREQFKDWQWERSAESAAG